MKKSQIRPFLNPKLLTFILVFVLIGWYIIVKSFASTSPTSRPPYALGCETSAVNISTAAALRTAVSNGQNSCVTANVGNVDLSGIKRASPVYIGTNGGSIGAIDMVGSKYIVLRQARIRSVDIRDSQFITIEKSTLGGTSSARVLDNVITSLGYSPGIDTSDDVTIQDNDIGWTTADTSGNTGYGIRVYGGDRFKVLRNYIHNIGADGIQMGSDGVDNVIDRNEIAYVAPPPTSDEHSDDIQITGHGQNLQITNNYLHHNGWLDAGGQNSGGSGPYIHGGSGTNSLRFENNLIRDERNFMQVADLGTGGTSISNLTFRRNTFYNNGTMWPDGTDLSWQIASGSNNVYERNVVNDTFGNKYGFGGHTANNNNLHGSAYTINANGDCTVSACNPASQEAIGYRCPTDVWWCTSTNSNPPPTILLGDINNDTVVNIFDLSILLSHYGQTGQTAGNGDLNADSIVNIFDLSILLSNYGKTGGGSMTCALPDYPNANCTGVPPGTAFTNTINGDYTVDIPGQVIDKWHITGNLLIHADNTTVTNSQIDKTVDNQGSGENYYSFTIADSTVGPPSACTKDSPASCQNGTNSGGCIVSPGIGQSKYIATRVYVRGHDDGFRMSGTGSATVQDSYFYACYLNATYSPPDGSHSDGVQAYCGGYACSGLSVLHTTLDLSGVPVTFPLNLNDPQLSTVTANDNMLLGGGNYLIDAMWSSGANWIFHNNRLVQGTWGRDTRLIAAITADGTCSHQDWQGNTVVTIDSNYKVTSTVQPAPCQD